MAPTRREPPHLAAGQPAVVGPPVSRRLTENAMPRDSADPRETVLQAGSLQARIAKVYAEALLAAALKQGDADAVDDVGDELNDFVKDVLRKNANVANFLTSPAVG